MNVIYLTMYHTFTASVEVMGDPASYREAMASPQAAQWKEATDSEMDSLNRAGTWTLVVRPPGARVIGVKWVFKTKCNELGQVARYKGRLVAQGFRQVPGVDCGDAYAPVARYSSVRVILAFVAIRDWHVHQMDVETAFLNAHVTEEVYLQQPEGYKRRGPNGEELVYLLHRALYGLRDSGHLWNVKLDKWLKRYGLRPRADMCIYVMGDENTELGILIIIVYVDDLIIVASKMRTLMAFKMAIAQVFRMKDLGELRWVLGMEVRRDRATRTLELRQTAYIDRVLERFGMSDCVPVSTPAVEGLQLPRMHGCNMPNSEYMSIVGSLQYAAQVTRPDIAYIVHVLSRHLQCAGDEHMAAAKRVLRYLKGTRTLGLKFGAAGARAEQLDGYAQDMVGFSDANYAGDLETRRSTTGYAFKIGGASVSWASRLQRTVALASTEAEYMAASAAVQEAVYLRRLLGDLGIVQRGPTVIMEDNQGCIALSENPLNHQRTKHIDVRYHYIREKGKEGVIRLLFVGTDLMQADIFTKPLGPQKLVYHRDRLQGYKHT
jgi:hypothetical protein